MKKCLMIVTLITLVLSLSPVSTVTAQEDFPLSEITPQTAEDLITPGYDPNANQYYFRRSWGGEGQQILKPDGIAVDTDGKVFILVSGLGRVMVVSQEDSSSSIFGGLGTFAGQLYQPSDLEIGADGFVYIADSGNARILKFTKEGAYVTLWGGAGEAFNNPQGVAVSSAGYVYVSDTNNNRIQKFTSSGVFVKQWGASGTNPGQFDLPKGIAVDANGNVYVADSTNNRIQKFDADGNFLRQWGTTGSGQNQFLFPREITVNEQGQVLVSDGNGLIRSFTSEGKFIKFLLGSSPAPQLIISGLAADLKGDVYVAYENVDEVNKYSSSGSYKTSFGSKSASWGSFNNPNSLVIKPNGEVLVVDTGNHRLQVFTPYGSLLKVIGRAGSANGEFQSPKDVAIDANGNYYVADSQNSRVQVFNSDWQYLRKFGGQGTGDGQWNNLSGIALDSVGNVYTLDRYAARIQVFNASGTWLNSWNITNLPSEATPTDSLYIDRSDRVYIVSDVIYQYDTNGNFIRTFGTSGVLYWQLVQPWSIDITSDGKFLVTDQGHDVVKVLDSYGDYLFTVGLAGYTVGKLTDPSAVVMGDNGSIYILDRSNQRVQVFTSTIPLPDVLTGLVQNGSFEKTPSLLEWTYGGSLTVRRSTDTAYQGSYSLQLGKVLSPPQTAQGTGQAWAYTNFYVDPNWTQPVLTFKYEMRVNDLIDWSDFFVAVQDGAGLNHLTTVLRDGYKPCNPGKPPSAGQNLGWRNGRIDLSPYKGQYIRIVFQNRNLHGESWGIWTFLDDVRVWDDGPLPPISGPYELRLPLVYHGKCDN